MLAISKRCWHPLQRTFSFSASLNRSSSLIWESRVYSSSCSASSAATPMWNLLVSSPRHSAIRATSVPSIGAHKRAMGGWICWLRYHSKSVGWRVSYLALGMLITDDGVYLPTWSPMLPRLMSSGWKALSAEPADVPFWTPSTSQITYGMVSPAFTLTPVFFMRRATWTCGWLLASA